MIGNHLRQLSIFLFAASFLLATLTITPARALTEPTLDFFSQNDILFYDPDGRLHGASTSCAFPTMEGSTLFEKVLAYLLSLGLTDYAAAGIFGNMMAEGLSSTSLLEHENGTDDIGDIGTYYAAANLYITEHQVRDLDDPTVMHGLGFIQWSFGRRVNLLNALAAAGGLDQYARAWDGSRYTYDGVPYEQLVGMIGQATADAILIAELDFFNTEHQSYTVTSDDIAAQGLSSRGITPGMSIFDALNRTTSAAEAAELFFTTSEMPGLTRFNSTGSQRIAYAEQGYDLIHSASLTAGTLTDCEDNWGSTIGGTLAEVAVQLAWPYADGTCTDGSQTVNWQSNPSACYDDIKPEYREAMLAVLGSEPSGGYCGSYGHISHGSLDYYQDCGHFVATVVRASGTDPGFPLSGTSNMEAHMASSSLWQEVENLGNTSNLQPGDIMVINIGGGSGAAGHIQIYTGDVSSYGDLASASLCGRTGNMGNVYFTSHGTSFRIFRAVN